MKTTLIKNEEVASLHFPSEDILFSKTDAEQRAKEIQKSIIRGSLELKKVEILFQDIEGLKKIETIIWGVSDNSIILKEGVVIPIHRIEKINV